MMRSDALNLHVYPVRTKMTDPSSNICYTAKDESKGIIVQKTLSQSCSTDKDESKGIIVKKTLSQICSTDENRHRGSSLPTSIMIEDDHNGYDHNAYCHTSYQFMMLGAAPRFIHTINGIQ